jgi:hypothetical protein
MAKTNHTPGSFCWFELGTTDQNAAKKFYPAIFGWDVNDTPMGPEEVYTTFKIKGLDASAAYTLRPDQRAQGVPAHWMPYVTVKSADDAASKAQSLGGKMHAPPFDVMDHGRMSVLQDPTGGMFCVWQPIKHVGTGVTQEDGTAVWADLSTPDQAKAGKFYSDLFGWKMVSGESMKPAAPGEYFHIVNGKDMIGGIQPADHRPAGVPAHWLLYYQVSDCDGTIAKTKSLGGRVIQPAMTMGDVRKFAVLSDPQGAVFALVQALRGQDTGQDKIRPAAKRAKPAAKKARKAAPKKARKAAPKKTRKAAAKKTARKKGKAKK